VEASAPRGTLNLNRYLSEHVGGQHCADQPSTKRSNGSCTKYTIAPVRDGRVHLAAACEPSSLRRLLTASLIGGSCTAISRIREVNGCATRGPRPVPPNNSDPDLTKLQDDSVALIENSRTLALPDEEVRGVRRTDASARHAPLACPAHTPSMAQVVSRAREALRQTGGD
jgi:hypothetical protein